MPTCHEQFPSKRWKNRLDSCFLRFVPFLQELQHSFPIFTHPRIYQSISSKLSNYLFACMVHLLDSDPRIDETQDNIGNQRTKYSGYSE